MSEANKKVWKYLYNGIKFLMIPAFITNYFDVLYGGYLWLALVMFAAFFKAMADTCAHHFSTSIFRDLNANFYDASVSWKKPTIAGYRFDFWHLCNSLMIVSFAFAIVTYTNPNARWVDFLLGGYYFNTLFSLFYDIVLRRK